MCSVHIDPNVKKYCTESSINGLLIIVILGNPKTQSNILARIHNVNVLCTYLFQTTIVERDKYLVTALLILKNLSLKIKY